MYSCLHPCLKCVVWVINDDKQKNKAVKDWKNSDFCSQRNLPVRLIMIGKYIKKKGRKCKCYYTKLTKVKKWWKLFTHLKRKKKKKKSRNLPFSLLEHAEQKVLQWCVTRLPKINTEEGGSSASRICPTWSGRINLGSVHLCLQDCVLTL